MDYTVADVDETMDDDEKATSVGLQATIELRFPVNSGRNCEIQQLMDGHFKVPNQFLTCRYAKKTMTPLHAMPAHPQVIQCHLDPSEGHPAISAISLFLKVRLGQGWSVRYIRSENIILGLKI